MADPTPSADPKVVDPNAAPPEGGTPTTTEGTPAAEGTIEAGAPKWALNRISGLTAEKTRLALENQELKRAKANGQADPAEGSKPSLTEAEIEERVNAKTAENTFAMSCNAIYLEGKKEFNDFEESVQTFKALGGLPRSIVEASMEIGGAHKILYNLSRNPEEAYRIINLPIARQAAALAKLASGPAPKTVSTAPAPVGSKVGSGSGTGGGFNPSNPNQSMDDYVAGRKAQEKEKYAERQRLGRR